MGESQTFAAHVLPSVRATIVSREIGGRPRELISPETPHVTTPHCCIAVFHRVAGPSLRVALPTDVATSFFRCWGWSLCWWIAVCFPENASPQATLLALRDSPTAHPCASPPPPLSHALTSD
jgi:hypothetical protein